MVITTDRGDSLEGHGLSFTLGRGTEVIAACIESLAKQLVKGRELGPIFANFGGYFRQVHITEKKAAERKKERKKEKLGRWHNKDGDE